MTGARGCSVDDTVLSHAPGLECVHWTKGVWLVGAIPFPSVSLTPDTGSGVWKRSVNTYGVSKIHMVSVVSFSPRKTT